MRETKILLSLFILFCFSHTSFAEKLPAAGVATAHPAATAAGHEILQAGGNAFDAAVAISAALAVAEPMSSGIGGGGFWLLHRDKDDFQIMVDGRETAPGRAHPDMYLDKNGDVITNLSMDGALAAAIPGLPAALVHISRKYGLLSLKQSLQPAIKLAENGIRVTEHYHRLAKFRLDALRQSPAAAKIFLKSNHVPAVGDFIQQPDLANTLKSIAEHGKDGFYTGKMAKMLIDGVREAGGIWTTHDLSSYKIVERVPIRGNYKGLQITSASPPSSGGVALLTILNILSGYDLQKYDDAQKTHLVIEAMRRAYRDRAIYLGDPDYVDVPTFRLLHPNYAEGLRAGIHLEKALPSEYLQGVETPTGSGDTTHFSVIDKLGNRVSATLTINYPFGACFVPPGTGVLLNDEMDDFSAKPGVPNAYGLVGAEANSIAPGKRPLSSMSPTFVEDERGVLVLGTPGGSRIISMVLLGILEYAQGGDPESIVTRPRYHHQYLPDAVTYEDNAFSEDVMNKLQRFGHQLKLAGWRYGNMQAVMWNKQLNEVHAASDPRVEGLAEVK